MTAPRLGMGMPQDYSWVARELRNLQRQITELQAARSLEASTIGSGGLSVQGGSIWIKSADGTQALVTLDADGLTVDDDGVLTINGELTVSTGVAQSGDYSAGSSGWALKANGDAEFNSLTLRGGIIGDDALANPLRPASATGASTNFSIGTAEKQIAKATISAPAGFTTALVTAITTIIVYNGNSFASSANAYVDINGNRADVPLGTGTIAESGFGYITNAFTTELTGLSSGDTVTSSAYIYNGNSIPADPTNEAHTYATAMFLR